MKFQEIVSSHPLVLVDFYADWCGPCKMMAPALEELKKEMGEKLKIVKINTEKNQALSAQFNIRSIPTIHLYKDGNRVVEQAGALMLPQLRKMVGRFA